LRIAVSQDAGQLDQGGAGANAGPERSWLAAAETPRALRGDLEWRGDDAADLCVDVASDRFVDLANEAKREVKLLDRAPRCAGNFALERHEPLGCGFWNGYGKKKAKGHGDDPCGPQASAAHCSML
jgi:hypothetical protein